MSRRDGRIKIKLLTGVTIYADHPGALPSILFLEADGDSDRGARVPCQRIDLDTYQQLTIEEMIDAGLIRPVRRESAEAGTGIEAEPGDPAEP